MYNFFNKTTIKKIIDNLLCMKPNLKFSLDLHQIHSSTIKFLTKKEK